MTLHFYRRVLQDDLLYMYHRAKKATIHQVTTMLAISKNVLFPGYNYVLTTGTDDLSLTGAWAIKCWVISTGG